MWASLVGRLDPKTGEMKEYPSAADGKTPQHRSRQGRKHLVHGQQQRHDRQARSQNRQDHRIQDQGARPALRGVPPERQLYFTAQGARMIGRLSPETGEITEVPTEPNPYGIQVGPDGTLWVAYNGTNKIGAVNPDTLAIRYYEVPDAASRIRRLGLTSDGMVWYGNSTRGRIGRLNPTTGEIKEWPSPSGPTFPSLCLRRCERHHLVQRVGNEAGCARAL